MKHFTNLLIGALVLVCYASVQAQDPHFSQYYASPLFLNPAMTGVVDGNARIIFNHRGQYVPIQNSYRAYGLSVDLPLNNRWGFGIGFKDQYAGAAFYNYLNAVASVSYSVPVNADQTKNIVFGGQLGTIQRTFDPEKATWGSQFIPGLGYDPSNPSGEMLTQRENKIAADANFGVMFFDGNPNKKANFFGGVAAYHLNNPNTAFAGERSPGGIKWVANAGVRVKAGKFLDLVPSVIYMNQKSSQNLIVGMTGYYSLMQADANLIFGAMYRVSESAIPYLGMQYKNFTLGLSYDINVNELSQQQQRKGSYELSLTYIVRKFDYSRKFVCPRL